MNNPSPPPPPDPMATARAQGQMNKETAIAQGELNAVNQITPYGSLNYAQTGKWEDGTPQFTATTSLSPEQQDLYNLGTTTQKTLGQIGVEQSDRVRGILNTPFDFNSSINNQTTDIARNLLDPVWKQREDAVRTRLANEGVPQGSQAWLNAMREFGDERDRAYLSAQLGTRAQAATEALTNRNQPLNEITALLSGSAVHQPSFVNTPQESIAAPDYEGAVANNYAGQMAGYNAKLANNSAMMGGLFGLAAAPLGGWARGGFQTPGFLR